MSENTQAPGEPVAWDDRAQQHRVLSELQEILHEAAGHGISPSFDLLCAVRDMISHPSAAAEPVSQPYTLAGEPVAWKIILSEHDRTKDFVTDDLNAVFAALHRGERSVPLYPHPRPRVGVTEAMKEAGAKQMYEGPESVLGVWRNASEQTKDHYRALAEGCLTAALALVDEAAPTDARSAVRLDRSREWWMKRIAREDGHDVSAGAPDSPLANGGGEVNGDD